MKLKPKGRKIYRYKTRFDRVKGFFRNSGAVILTIAGVAVLGFVGYSVGAPVMEFLEERDILTASTEPPAVPTESVPFAEESDFSETSVAESQDTQKLELHGYRLDADALATQQALTDALQLVPDGITHIIVPLKTVGGMLHYATALTDASMSGAVVSAVPLEIIYSTITNEGFVPAASINALEDSIYPKTYADAGYLIAGSQERWLDNTPENDGKPWLSPFSALAIDYLSNMTVEAVDAGFPLILCEGLTFPEFSENDLTLLDPRAGAPDRGSALADVVNAMQAAAGDAAFLICMDGEVLLDGDVEVFSTGKTISPDGVVVSADEQTAQQLGELTQLTDGIPIVLQMEDVTAARAASADGNYIVFPGMTRDEAADDTIAADTAGE